MSILPTRVIIENKQKKAKVSIKNNGDSPCHIKAEIIDLYFDEDWKIIENAAQDKYSAKDMIRVSPRSFTVGPKTTQTIWLKVRRSEDKSSGEYRSHLQIFETGGNNYIDIQKNKVGSAKADVKSVPLSFKLTFPVLVRMGEMDYKVKIKEATIAKDADNKLQLNLIMNRSGNRTAYGSIKASYKDEKNQEHLVGESGEFAIYRSNDVRKLAIPLSLDKSQIPSKKITIRYVTGKEDGYKVLDQRELNL